MWISRFHSQTSTSIFSVNLETGTCPLPFRSTHAAMHGRPPNFVSFRHPERQNKTMGQSLAAGEELPNSRQWIADI